jgi:aminoglycoside 6'-N-acetyltransferase I
MNIIKVTQDVSNQEDFRDWLDLAMQVWPDCPINDLTEIIQSSRQAGFLIRNETRQVIGLMNLSLRYDFVPDATQSPVGYVEGIYIKAEYRKQGVGAALIQYAEQWAYEQGCIELALDALLENPESHEFYAKVGFREVERVIFFIKSVVAGDLAASPEKNQSISEKQSNQ